ncbi:unnamed protein product [Closterium sp. NIES-64]|nr:unnamed protein product [Closterium sp. NIES-64]
MYAVTGSDEDDCYRCFPPDPGIGTAASGTSEAAALGASASVLSGTGESALSGTVSASASHTFTLDSGASRSFFRDRTTLTPLSRPVAVSLADPSGGPVLSRFSTVLPCPAAPSGTLTGLYLPSFSTNLVSGADLQDAGVHQFTPARQRVTHCTEADTGRHLATFTRRPGSSLYTLTTASPPGTASGRAPSSGQVFAAASRSGPESAPCSCRRLSHETLLWHHRLGHPSLLRLRGMASRVLVSGLPRSLPPLPPGPGPACVPCVEGRQRAAPHSSQFPPTEAPLQTLHMDVWGPACVRGQGQERYFLLVVDDYSRYTTVFPCAARTFTLPDSPQQNGIAERRIGMVMDVARTSMMHAAAPHFLWPFAVTYAAHQINLHPRVSRPETSPALLWTGKVGDASAFRVWGSRAFVRDLSADKLSPRASPCVFLGFPPDAPGWQFYHPTSRRVLSSQDVTFDESVPYYRLFPYRTPSLPPPPLFLVDAVEPVEVTGDSGVLWGAEPGGAESGGAGPGGAEPGGAEPGGAVPGGASSHREPLSPQELREWFARRWRRAAGAGGSSAAEGAAATRPDGARPVGAGAAGSECSPGAGPAEDVGAEPAVGGPTDGAPGAAAGGSGASGGSAGGAAGVGAPAGGAGAVPAVSGVAARPRPYFVPLLQQWSRVASASSSCPWHAPDVTASVHCSSACPFAFSSCFLSPALADPESDSLRAASPTVTRLLATAVTDPSFESSAASALVTELVDFAARCRLDYAARLVAESESACPPSVGGECALGTDVLEDRQEEFQCLAAASPRLASVLLAPEGDPDALDIPTPRSYAEAVEGPYSSQWQAAMDAEMASWKSTGTYVDAVPPPGANIVSGMWIFRVKRRPRARRLLCLKARYVARGFSQRQGVDYFQTFSPTPKMTTLRVLLHIAAQRDYELHSLDFSTAFLQGSLHEEIWLRRPPGFTGTFPPGTQAHGCSEEGIALPVQYVGHGASAWRAESSVVLTGHADASWADDQATQRSSQGYTFSLVPALSRGGSTRSSSVLGSSCEAEIYAGAMAAQELRWLTYLLTDLGELPRSPPVLYVDNKAMLALCREQRLEHRTKHIALRYFLARELQQRGQLRLAYVASEANTADVFTKALAPCDHQRFCTQLGLVPVLPHLLSS